MSALVLDPAMPLGGPVDWPGARWVGKIDRADAIAASEPIRLRDGDGFHNARLLVVDGPSVRGFVEVPVEDSLVDPAALRAELHGLPPAIVVRSADGRAVDRGGLAIAERVTVAICTRDRPARLRLALRSVLELDYDAFDVLIVDNAPSSPATRELIEREFRDPRVRYVLEPQPGVQYARQRSLEEATGTIVAFADDDVVVDPGWLTAIVAAFARGGDVVCVTGLVPSGELRSPVQAYFESRVSWSKNLRLREFRLSDPPKDLPMFPFSIGEFGTGANFALSRATVLAMGGFDERLGTAEDLDIFIRVLFARHALVITPDAVVWHRHRSDVGALAHQARGYGVGLGAWLTKIMLTPRMRREALRRAPVALFRLLTKNRRQFDELPELDEATRAAIAEVGNLELRSVLEGPRMLLGGRGRPRPARSLLARLRAERPRWAHLAMLGGLAGLLGAIPGLPVWLSTLLVGAFVFLGPGAALTSLVGAARSLAVALVPLTGVSLVLVLATIQADLRGWAPTALLLASALVCVAAGALLRVRDAVREW